MAPGSESAVARKRDGRCTVSPRDGDRVDVERLPEEVSAEPGITGGYMLKIDRADPGDNGFSAAGQQLR